MQAKINGVTIGFDDYGQGPAVVFIHDYPLNRKMWQPQVEDVVNAGYRVILLDLRGFGESDQRDENVAISTYSDDVIGLLNYLGIGRAVVCGLSLGGYVLFDLMERYPQRIVGACLASSRPVADDIPERVKRAEIRSALEKGQLAEVRKQLLEMQFSGQVDRAPAELQETVRNFIDKTGQQALDRCLEAIAQRKDYTFLLKKLEIPTFLVAAQYDRITHHKHTEIMAQQLPNCYRAVSLESGHLVNLERSKEFNRYLLDFLHNLVPRRTAGTELLQPAV